MKRISLVMFTICAVFVATALYAQCPGGCNNAVGFSAGFHHSFSVGCAGGCNGNACAKVEATSESCADCCNACANGCSAECSACCKTCPGCPCCKGCAVGFGAVSSALCKGCSGCKVGCKLGCAACAQARSVYAYNDKDNPSLYGLPAGAQVLSVTDKESGEKTIFAENTNACDETEANVDEIPPFESEGK